MDCCGYGQGRRMLKNLIDASLDGIFWTAESFVTKLSMVIHHHKLECHAKERGCCFQGHGHSKGLYVKTDKVHSHVNIGMVYMYVNIDDVYMC